MLLKHEYRNKEGQEERKMDLWEKIRDERRDCRTVAGAGDQCGNGNDCLGCIVFCNQMVVKNGIMEVY